MKNNISAIVLCGLGIALTFLLTAFIAVPIGQFGYVNLGDSSIMLFACMLTPTQAFFVGGVASAIADLYLGYSHYALFTLVVKGLEGLFIAFFMKRVNDKFKLIIFVLGMLIMVGGYYLTDALLYGGFIVAIAGVGFNFTQGIVSVIIASTIYTLLKKYLPKVK